MRPSGVRDVAATLATKDSVVINWKPPQTGGKPVGYTIRCGDITAEVPGEVNRFFLKGFPRKLFNNTLTCNVTNILPFFQLSDLRSGD